jgi:hypothetical protein
MTNCPDFASGAISGASSHVRKIPGRISLFEMTLAVVNFMVYPFRSDKYQIQITIKY